MCKVGFLEDTPKNAVTLCLANLSQHFLFGQNINHPIFLQVYGVILSTFRSRLKLSNICYHNKISKIEISVYIQVYIQVYIHVCCTSKVIGRKDASHFKQHTYIKTLLLVFKSLFKYLLSQNFMLRIKELNLTCMINDSERITEKLGLCFEKLSFCFFAL